jgi:condensin complex subunit 2
LDASVKIYSHRVDDTHSSSHRILESLSRSYGDDDEDNDNDDGSPSTERRAARVGSKAASSRLNIAETLEKDPEKNLNAPMVDSAHTADPLFHKMSKAFDEGGAKGMLMTNLVR